MAGLPSPTPVLVIYETFEEWVKRRNWVERIEGPGRSSTAHTGDDVVVLVELLQGDADWCVVSYIGAG